ncbi:16.9 kDa class I heat shock protein 1-like [Curcuma longa]|uniref:16.9 kDa class I heat shock protein 1-like n=1 Tax=Curcuma longa TaxID=136217 RepID=UPI003D9DDC4E
MEQQLIRENELEGAAGHDMSTSSIIQHSAIDPFAQALWGGAPSSAISADAGGDLAATGMKVDWKETAEGHVIRADLPGVRKEEIKVEVERGGALVISGERHLETQQMGDTWRQVERSSGRFTRRLQLPEDAKLDGVTATIEHGVLTVHVPKTKAALQQITN